MQKAEGVGVPGRGTEDAIPGEGAVEIPVGVAGESAVVARRKEFIITFNQSKDDDAFGLTQIIFSP